MIPENWKEYSLEEVASFKSGKTRPLTEGPYPVYGGNGVLGFADNYNSESEVIIIGRVGAYCGSVFYEDKPLWISDNALMTLPRNSNNGKFLFYLFKLLNLHRYAQGSSHPLLTQTILNDIHVTIPIDSNEQSLIASILSSLDDKIKLNLQMNNTLESFAQAIFKEWFVDFRFPGFDSELVNGLPKGWRRGTVADLLTISKNTISPSDYPQKEFYHYSIPAFDEGKTPVKERGKTILSNKFIVRNNSILISKLNPRFPRIWPIRDIDEERCICSTEFLVLQPKTINNYSFIISFLNLNSTMNSMAGLVTGTSSSHQRIRPLDLMSLPLTLPNINLMDEYERTVSVIVERYIRNINENQTLTQLRDAILPKLMTGKIRVA